MRTAQPGLVLSALFQKVPQAPKHWQAAGAFVQMVLKMEPLSNPALCISAMSVLADMAVMALGRSGGSLGQNSIGQSGQGLI